MKTAKQILDTPIDQRGIMPFREVAFTLYYPAQQPHECVADYCVTVECDKCQSNLQLCQAYIIIQPWPSRQFVRCSICIGINDISRTNADTILIKADPETEDYP